MKTMDFDHNLHLQEEPNLATILDASLIIALLKMFTVKILKFWTPEKFAVITLKFEQGGSAIE